MKKKKKKNNDVQEELQKDFDREVHTHFEIAPFLQKRKKK
mgnify:CR=1 FL=1|jgi:hypothetical protein|tara:strand:+ start:548 stop:667 length:120 start_codon:yes stop_codon:yes gene_type:complete